MSAAALGAQLEAAPRGGTRIGYLTSKYPAVSHTFVLREVTALRARGVDVVTYSVRASDASELLSDADRLAFASTFAILPVSLGQLLATHLRGLREHPRAYGRALRRAVRMAGDGPRALTWQLFYFAEAVVLWDRARADGVDHLHAQFANVATDVALLASELGAACGEGPTSWSFTLHGPVEFYDVTSLRLAEKARRARFVVCISDFARSQLMAQVETDVWPQMEIVHCGVDPEVYAPPQRPTPPPGSPLRILSVGRLTPHKGQTILLQAVATLRERGVDSHVTLVGDGPDRVSLERLSRELSLDGVVSFAGAVGQDEIRDYFVDADVFCLPSFAEGVPVVLMEAMAMELPVVTTRIAGIPELVNDGVTGLLTAPGRVDTLADALGRLAADPSERHRLGRLGRIKVVQDYDVRKSAARLEGIFDARLLPDTAAS